MDKLQKNDWNHRLSTNNYQPRSAPQNNFTNRGNYLASQNHPNNDNNFSNRGCYSALQNQSNSNKFYNRDAYVSNRNQPHNNSHHSANDIEKYAQFNQPTSLQRSGFSNNNPQFSKTCFPERTIRLNIPQIATQNLNSVSKVEQNLMRDSLNTSTDRIPQTQQANPLYNKAPQLNISSLPLNNRFQAPITNTQLQSFHNPGNAHPQINTTVPPPVSLPQRPLGLPNFINVPPPPISVIRNAIPNSYNSQYIQPAYSNLPSNNYMSPTPDMVLRYNSPNNQSLEKSSSGIVNHPIIKVATCDANFTVPVLVSTHDQEKETKITKFLEKFSKPKKNLRMNVTVKLFRNTMKDALFFIRELKTCKEKLKELLDENEWNSEVQKALHYQNCLTQACNFLEASNHLEFVKKKIKSMQKKRNIKKRQKQKALEEKANKLKQREELYQEINKWMDSIKEKNLKLKREAEMKKEADIILSEVRKKIQEAKRTIEKLKVFEKLRVARQANATKRGLFLPEHDDNFKNKMSDLKETILRQLAHYESEEKAMKVMLEAEQEGQIEEEVLWKVKKLQTLQQRRHKNITTCLFGDSDAPEKDDPLYLFWQYQTSGMNNIENLVQIRHQWDMYINENGESVPQKWVVPVPPSSSGWQISLSEGV